MQIKKGARVQVKGRNAGRWQDCIAKEDFNSGDERWPLLAHNEEAKQLIDFEPLSERCELRIMDERGNYKKVKKEIQIWEELEQIISSSKIKRYPWKLILGDSLTKTILRKKMAGKKAQEAYDEILGSERFMEIKKAFPEHAIKMEKNVFISVCARFGENDTALSLYRKEFNQPKGGDQNGNK